MKAGQLSLPLNENPLAPLAWLIRRHVQKSGRSLTACANDVGLKQQSVSVIINGVMLKGGKVRYIRHLSSRTIHGLHRMLDIPMKEIKAMVPVTREEMLENQGRKLGNDFAQHPKRRSGVSRAKKGKPQPWAASYFRIQWAEHRQTILTRLRSQATVKRPENRVKNLLGLWHRWHPNETMTAHEIESLARRSAARKRFEDGGLPLLYIRGKCFELTGIPWPGKHRPALRRFELVYEWKRQKKTWQEISKLLAQAGDFNKQTGRPWKPTHLKVWWSRFFRPAGEGVTLRPAV